MSKNYKPIVVVSGDPKSIFLEIFFKTFQIAKRPLVLIVSKKILKQQIKLLKTDKLCEQGVSCRLVQNILVTSNHYISLNKFNKR